jgi:8-hydroxy-5-deazaflavin:NADPH oxidoreductase
MRVGVLGSGLMGGKLGTIFARAGHKVTFSYSRDDAKLEKLARGAGDNARAGIPAEAVTDADAVVLAVHWTRVDDVLQQAGSLSGKTLITCSMPMSADDSRMVIGLATSGAEALAAKMPRAHVVSAFSTAPSEVLFPVFNGRRRANRPDMVYCGNDATAKRKAARLIRDAGFHPVDLGELKAARNVEPFVLLIAGLAYDRPGGPRITYRFDRMAR